MTRMSPVAAPKCQHEGCQNPTWYGLCHHHQSGSSAASAPSVISAPPSTSLKFMHYSNVSDLWSDLIGAFPDAGEVVQPKTIRQEALDTLSAAVDNEVYRRFPDIDVADYDERESLVNQMREQLIHELLPEPSHVTGSEARELSYSSVDQYGRSAEDSRYLASFALNAEWECQRIIGNRADISFEQFVQDVAPDMREAIDMSFRRNLGSFTDIIRQVSHRDPLNPDPIAPHLVIQPMQARPQDYDVIAGEVVGEPVDEITDWFNTNRQYIAEHGPADGSTPPPPARQPSISQDQGYQQYPTQQYNPQQGNQPEESVFGQLLRKGVEAAKVYIEDPDGKRLAARQERERKQAERQAREDAQLKRDLDKELLISRKKRNRGW